MANAYTYTGSNAAWTLYGEQLIRGFLKALRHRYYFWELASKFDMQAMKGVVWHLPTWGGTNAQAIKDLDVINANEHVSPDSVRITMNQVQGTIVGYGGVIGITDVQAAVLETPGVMAGAIEELGSQLAIEVDEDLKAMLIATLGGATSPIKITANDATAWATGADSTDEIIVDTLFAIVRELEDKSASTWDDGADAHIIMHGRGYYDLQTNVSATKVNVSDWLATESGQAFFGRGRAPMIANCVIHKSNRSTAKRSGAFGSYTWVKYSQAAGDAGFAAGKSGYYCWAFTPKAYTVVRFAGGRPKLHIHPFGEVRGDDTLDRQMTIGLKYFSGMKEVDLPNRGLVMAHGASTGT